MADKVELLIKCMKKDLREDIVKSVQDSGMPEEKKEEIINQLEGVSVCRGQPIKLESVESIGSLSEVLDGTLSILVEDGCPECVKIKEKINPDKVELVDITTAHGEKVTAALGSKLVPTAFTYKGGKPVKCELFSDKDQIIIKCGDKKVSVTAE